MDMTLPEMCAVRVPATGEVAIVKRGVCGYFQLENVIDPNAYNEERGITPAQREAMMMGSLFGWNVPGAYAKTWSERDVPRTI